jgi:putative copper resistance protein D
LLLATGIVLAWRYVGSWQGLLGTGYGSLVLAKTWLLAVDARVGGTQFLGGPALAARSSRCRASRVACRFSRGRGVSAGRPVVPRGERFVAAAGDGHPDLTAAIPEVVQMFAPKRPALSTPAHNAYLTDEAARSALAGKPPSDRGHTMVGLQPQHRRSVPHGDGRCGPAVLSTRIFLGALLAVGFMALAVFLFFRSDAETWPLGPVGFWHSTLGDTEVLQHRMATALAFALGGWKPALAR